MAGESHTTEALTGMLLFHTSSAAALASLLAHRGDMVEEIYEAIDRSVAESKSITEHALWETIRDFFNPEIDRISGIVNRHPEGENIIKFPDDVA